MECQDKNALYNPADYILTEGDFARLWEERPVGISGHLRVKNEAGSVKECVESVIEHVDELIVTYQPSQDSTQEIVQTLAAVYPDKIRLFCYMPYVPPFTYYERDHAVSNEYPDPSSIHNAANYYNYGYTKIKYKYYMKVDADQIYFPQKWTVLREYIHIIESCYRESPSSPSIFYKINRKFAHLLSKLTIPTKLKIFLAVQFGATVNIHLAGINISTRNQTLCMPIGKNGVDPFNGLSADLLLWAPTGDQKYLWNETNLYEIIYPCGLCVATGFHWLHLGCLKNGVRCDSYTDKEVIPLETLSSVSKHKLVKDKKILQTASHFQTVNFMQYWDGDRKNISDSLVKICYQIKDYFDTRVTPNAPLITKTSKD